MNHYGREDIGVAIPDGSGYVGTLNVYHELHCIVRLPRFPYYHYLLTVLIQKRLHQYMYEDHYFPNITTSRQKEMNRLHNGKSSFP